MKIFKAFMWFSTVVGIAAVTMSSIFVMKEYSSGDSFSAWAGTIIIFMTMVAGLYWGYRCFDKCAEVFKKDTVKELEGDEFDF